MNVTITPEAQPEFTPIQLTVTLETPEEAQGVADLGYYTMTIPEAIRKVGLPEPRVRAVGQFQESINRPVRALFLAKPAL